MCGFDYDEDGTYLGTQRPRLVHSNHVPTQLEQLQEKKEQAWISGDAEEEAWIEFEIALEGQRE